MQRPNIILINCDDLGYGDLGCYGSTRNRTPELDALAAEGVRLTDFHMASSVCTPSRGAMMTGCYPPRIGFGDLDGKAVLFPGDALGLHEDELTLPELLRREGYATAMVGKWHCGDQPEFLPTRRGFDSYYGLPYSNDMGRQRGREDSPPLPLIRGDEVIQEQPDQAGLTERYTEECVRFLRERSRDRRPFFLYLAHLYVHVPLFVPPRFLDASINGPYGGAVEHIDWTMGVLRRELARLGLREDTLVILTSDNGSRARDEGGSNAPCRGTKASCWEGGYRVPCIVSWPGRLAGGRTVDGLATGMDLLPTLVGLAGGAVPADRSIDGRDLWPLLSQPGAASPHEDFAYYFKDDLVAVRSGPWKLHFLADGALWGRGEERETLYHLEEDPGEERDRLAEEPAVAARLRAVAERFRAELGDARRGIVGSGRRPAGRAADPRPLTTYDPDHPYMVAMYDLADQVMAG